MVVHIAILLTKIHTKYTLLACRSKATFVDSGAGSGVSPAYYPTFSGSDNVTCGKVIGGQLSPGRNLLFAAGNRIRTPDMEPAT
jgi:hypothetical protein